MHRVQISSFAAQVHSPQSHAGTQDPYRQLQYLMWCKCFVQGMASLTTMAWCGLQRSANIQETCACCSGCIPHCTHRGGLQSVKPLEGCTSGRVICTTLPTPASGVRPVSHQTRVKTAPVEAYSRGLLTMEMRFSTSAIVLSWPRAKKVPVEVLTVLSTLLPVSLSTTVDLVIIGLACTKSGCQQIQQL